MKQFILVGMILVLAACAAPKSEEPKQTEVDSLKAEVESLKAQIKDAHEYAQASHDHCESTVLEGTAKPGDVEYYQMSVADSPKTLCDQFRSDCEHEDFSKVVYMDYEDMAAGKSDDVLCVKNAPGKDKDRTICLSVYDITER